MQPPVEVPRMYSGPAGVVRTRIVAERIEGSTAEIWTAAKAWMTTHN